METGDGSGRQAMPQLSVLPGCHVQVQEAFNCDESTSQRFLVLF